jgi:predicted Zn-dependent protease
MLALCAGHAQERQPGQGVNFYSKDKEIALGQKLAAEYRQKTTPLDDAAARDYVKRVGANLAAQFPGWTYQLELIREDQGGATHEPVAFPGGFIFVSADLIAAARNEAEFAGMLAHAMAHVAARHGTRMATRNDLASMASMTLSMPPPPGANGALPGPAPMTVPMGILAEQRAMESEADYLAVKAMAAAGYDPAGLASYVGRVQPPPGKGNPAVFATLPPRDQRVTGIEAEIRKLPAGAYAESDEFARVQAAVKALMAAPR